MNKSIELYKQKKGLRQNPGRVRFLLNIDFCCERFARIRILFVSA